MIWEWFRFILGTLVLLTGVSIFLLEVFGLYRFHFVLDRMHAAAMGDTLGIGVSLLGLIIFSGFNFTSLKMLLVVVFLWFASPVSSHLIARLEVSTNEESAKHYRILELDAGDSAGDMAGTKPPGAAQSGKPGEGMDVPGAVKVTEAQRRREL